VENKDSKKQKFHNFCSNYKSNGEEFKPKRFKDQSQKYYSKSLKDSSEKLQKKSKVHPEIDHSSAINNSN